MKNKVKQKYFIGDKIGIHEIIKVLEIKEVPNRSKRTFDLFYITKCIECGSSKEIAQKSIKNKYNSVAYYCSECPTEIKVKGRKRKQREYDELKRKDDKFSDKDKQLYNFFVFGK